MLLTCARHGSQFDKRSYCGGQYAPGPRRLERIPEPPVWEEGLHLQVRCEQRVLSVGEPDCRPTQPFFENGAPVTPEGLELMRLLVHTFNAAVDALPELPKARFACGVLALAMAEPSLGTRASLIELRRRRRRCRQRSRSASRTRCSAQ